MEKYTKSSLALLWIAPLPLSIDEWTFPCYEWDHNDHVCLLCISSFVLFFWIRVGTFTMHFHGLFKLVYFSHRFIDLQALLLLLTCQIFLLLLASFPQLEVFALKTSITNYIVFSPFKLVNNFVHDYNLVVCRFQNQNPAHIKGSISRVLVLNRVMTQCVRVEM